MIRKNIVIILKNVRTVRTEINECILLKKINKKGGMVTYMYEYPEISKMTYKEFKKFCNERACDGRWSFLEAISCLKIIEEIDSIKVKGLFKKKATERAREAEWRRRNYTSLR